MSPEPEGPPHLGSTPEPTEAPVPAPPPRRGRGLRLSTSAAEPPPATEPPPALATPPRRGRGLRLSTSAVELPTEPSPTALPAAQPIQHPPPAPPTSPRARPAGPAVRWRIQTATGPTSYLAAGSGPPLLLLHGWGASARLWVDALSALADQRSCYALDLPGSGESPARSWAPTLASMTGDVLAWIQALDLPHFDLLGHGLGAAIAAVIAANQPTRVGRVALLSLGVRGFSPDLLALNVARPPLDLSLGLARPLFNLWQPVNQLLMQSPPLASTLSAWQLYGSPANPARWHAYLADHARSDPRAYLTSLTVAANPQLHEALATLKLPCLCLAGAEDRVAHQEDVRKAHTLISGAALALINGCGHLPMIERPEVVNRALQRFFSDQETSPDEV